MDFKVILTIVVVLGATNAAIPSFNCDQGFNLQWMCSLEKVLLTRTNSSFKPISKDAKSITSVYITESKIPVLGEDICAEFPKTEHIWLSNVGIEHVKDTAFKKCTNLKRIFINHNPLRRLDENTFKYNTALEQIDLAHNHLRKIKSDLFYYNTKLEHLSLYDNHVREFKYDHVRKCKNLVSINVASNDLADLNEENFLDELTMLRDVSFNDNELSCGRILEINGAFESVGVTVRVVSAEKRRFYKMKDVDGMTCLDDEVWLAAYNRKSLTRK